MSSNSNTQTSKATKVASNQALIDGLNKHKGTLTSFAVGGTTIQATDVVTAVQADNAAMSAITPAKAAWQVTVQTAKSQNARTAAMVSGVKQALRVMFAGQIDVLADFGLKPRKTPTPRTPEQKAASVAKAKATRAARHTMGPVAKQAVKGNVVGVAVTPVIAPAAVPAPAAAAANSAPPATPAATGTAATPAPHIP